jgi:hypothetical protein
VQNNVTASNNGNNIQMSYSNASSSTVVYNNMPFTVDNVSLYSPSINLYNGSLTDAEIVIAHSQRQTNGGNMLYVCIPVSLSGNTMNSASRDISAIVGAVKSNAPTKGTSTSQNIPDIDLNSYIPMTKFYKISLNGEQDLIAFSLENSVNISQNDLTTLQTLLGSGSGGSGGSSSNMFSVPDSEVLVVNENGPKQGMGTSGSDIYIDCSPTDSSNERIDKITEKKTDTAAFFAFMLNYVLPIVIFMILIVAIRKLLDGFTQQQ